MNFRGGTVQPITGEERKSKRGESNTQRDGGMKGEQRSRSREGGSGLFR